MRSVLILILVFLLFMSSSCSHIKKLAWAVATNPYKKDKLSPDRGRKVYQKNCLSCHGENADGKGDVAKTLKVHPAHLVNDAKEHSDSVFAAHVAYGKSGSDEMPSFAEILSEKEIWDVTNYIYSLVKK